MSNRRPKGSVSVVTNHGSLQLRFRYQGERKYLALGLKDTPAHRKVALARAGLIEADLLFDKLDETLDKYRPESTIKPPKPLNPSLTELWALYTTHRMPLLSPNTVKHQYKSVASHLKRLPNPALSEHQSIRDWLIHNLTPDKARRVLVQINACLKWALDRGLVSHNPFTTTFQGLRKNRRQEIRPFSPEETKAILQAFDGTKYFPVVKFLFLTGCRTGEGFGLCWGDVKPDHSEICFRLSNSRGTITDTKTHKARWFPCGHALKSLLAELHPVSALPTDPIFQVGQKALWYQWKKRVGKLVKEGKVSHYRSQYHSRHTFISSAIEAGVPIHTVAKWCGNSSQTILAHYSGSISQHEPPELL